MSNTTLESINRMLSAFNRFLHVRSREGELRQATVLEATKKVELTKILDAERELTKARADNNQLRQAIESVRAERVGTAQKEKPKPKRTI